MSGHRGFFFMLALVPVAITGLLYASVVSVENTIQQQHKLQKLLAADHCNPQIEAGAIYDFPQDPPQDEPAPCVDGPNSVFHPPKNFDDLINRQPPEPQKAINVND